MTKPASSPGAVRWDCVGWVTTLLGMSLGVSCSTSSSTAPSAPLPLEAVQVTACGTKGLGDCPLQGWMKATLQAYLTAGDTARLATALDELSSHAPDGFASWSTMAQAGAAAARAGDVGKVRAACQSCHDAHRTVFRKQLRTARLF